MSLSISLQKTIQVYLRVHRKREQTAVEGSMKRYAFGLDLANDPQLIQEYEVYHQGVWPEIKASIKDAGIVNMEIYRIENRLFMIMDVDESFSFERKAKMDRDNPKVQEWEA